MSCHGVKEVNYSIADAKHLLNCSVDMRSCTPSSCTVKKNVFYSKASPEKLYHDLLKTSLKLDDDVRINFCGGKEKLILF